MSLLSENLRALSQAHPELVEVCREDPSPGIVVTSAASGEPTAIRDGVYVHSRYDPRREAASLVGGERGAASGVHGDGAAGSRAGSGAVDAAPTVGILLGFGLGYAAEEFRRVHPTLPLLVIEQDPDMLRTALRARDLRSLLASPEVRILAAPRAEDITPRLEELPMGNPLLLRTRSLMDRSAGYYRPMEEVIGSFILRRDININTLSRFGRLWVRNLSSNLVPFLASPGAGMCKGMFRGIPALLLAGGPSLDAVLPHLPELSQRLLIVSVDTPLSACLSTGVLPDFLVMVDPQFWASRYLDWTEGYDGFMVAEPSTHPRTLRGSRRRVLMASSLFPLGALLEEHTGKKGKLGAGGSVSTSAWDFCRLLGCSPIYIAGMDLGFPGHRTHCAGAFFEQSWFSISGRLSPAEGRAFSYLREIGVFPMPSNSGGRTLTDRRMLLYKWWFESQLSGAAEEIPDDNPPAAAAGGGTHAAAIDGGVEAAAAAGQSAAGTQSDAASPQSYSLSPDALAIRGMPLSSLQEALRLPVVRPRINELMSRARAAADAFGAGRKEAADRLGKALAGLIDGLRELESLSKKGLTATEELERLLKASPADAGRGPGAGHGKGALRSGAGAHRMPSASPEAVIRSLDEIDRRILELSSRDIVGFLMQGLIHRIIGASSRAAGRDEVLSSSRQMYDGILESARFHRGILSRAVTTLAQHYRA